MTQRNELNNGLLSKLSTCLPRLRKRSSTKRNKWYEPKQLQDTRARSQEEYVSSSNVAGMSRQHEDASREPEIAQRNDSEQLHRAGALLKKRPQLEPFRRDLHIADSSGRIYCSCICLIRSDSTSDRVCGLRAVDCDRDGVQSEHDAPFFTYLGEFEIRCTAKPETYADRKVPS